MAHQAIEVKAAAAMEDHHYSTLGKHSNCLFDEPILRLHAIHAMLEENYVVFSIVIVVPNECSSMYVG